MAAAAAQAQDAAKNFINWSDGQLGKVNSLTTLEKKTGVPKVYVAGGVAAVYFIGVLFNIGAAFLVNTVGFVIPGYYSLAALLTTTTTDDVQWLTYWVVFSFFTVVENLINPAAWFSLYYFLKLAIVLWLGLPQFSGAQVVFRLFLRPTFAPYFPKESSAGDLSDKDKHS